MSLRYFNSYYRDRVFGIVGTSFRRPHEVSNFTYALTERCLLELAHMVAVAAARPVEEILGYMGEVRRQCHTNRDFAPRLAAAWLCQR